MQRLQLEKEMFESMSNILDAASAGSRIGGPSFSLRNRMARGAWNLTWLILARWTPPPLHGWRRFLLRAFGADVAFTARIYGSTTVWYPPNLRMEDNAVMGPHANCYNQGMITIGAQAIVSQYAHLVSGTHNTDSAQFQLYVSPIKISAHAWVAANAFVGPGVIIGEGAVLGACGVAFRNLEPWTIYAGNPAREIRKRLNYLISPNI